MPPSWGQGGRRLWGWFLKNYWAKHKHEDREIGAAARDHQLTVWQISSRKVLILNTNKPIFTSQQSSYEDYSNTKRNKSLTKVLFCGKFNLSEDLFQQGLSNGDFQEIVEGKTSTVHLGQQCRTDLSRQQNRDRSQSRSPRWERWCSEVLPKENAILVNECLGRDPRR